MAFSNYFRSFIQEFVSFISCYFQFFIQTQRTSVGVNVIHLMDKYFLPHHKLHKLFNQNNVKISYSCMLNVKWIINKHNKTIPDPPTNNSERTCNCINSKKCSLQQKCLTNNRYKTTITSNQDNYHHIIY